jgi:pyruvate dehydrogenase E1 component beta subunit
LGAQHSQSLEAYFMHCPGIYIAVPATPCRCQRIAQDRYSRQQSGDVPEHELLYNSKGEVPENDDFTIPFGKANIMREGRDVTIAYSRMSIVALMAAAELEKEGVSCDVVDLRTLNPLDKDTFTGSVKKTGRAVVVSECWRTCGVGAEITSILYENCFDTLLAPVQRVSGLDVPMPYSRKIEKLCIPQVEDVMKAVKETLQAQY